MHVGDKEKYKEPEYEKVSPRSKIQKVKYKMK